MKREGDCYRLATQHIIAQQEGTLIHAEVWSAKQDGMIGHALVETETGFIYEPVLDRYFKKDWLYKTYKVKELKRYTTEGAMVMMLKEKNYGPWEEASSLA